jgi:hypothetical protein
MGPKTAADELADMLDRDDVPQPEDGGDPYEHVVARADAIAAFAAGLRDAERGTWPAHDLVTLDKMYKELAERADRSKVLAVAAAADWLTSRETADPSALVKSLAVADRSFGRLNLTDAELAMLRGVDDPTHKFGELRVVAALALRCGALGQGECPTPLDEAYESTLDDATDALKKARRRYRGNT